MFKAFPGKDLIANRDLPFFFPAKILSKYYGSRNRVSDVIPGRHFMKICHRIFR